MSAAEPHWWEVNIGSGNVLVAWRQQALTWANADPDLGHNELNMHLPSL